MSGSASTFELYQIGDNWDDPVEKAKVIEWLNVVNAAFRGLYYHYFMEQNQGLGLVRKTVSKEMGLGLFTDSITVPKYAYIAKFYGRICKSRKKDTLETMFLTNAMSLPEITLLDGETKVRVYIDARGTETDEDSASVLNHACLNFNAAFLEIQCNILENPREALLVEQALERKEAVDEKLVESAQKIRGTFPLIAVFACGDITAKGKEITVSYNRLPKRFDLSDVLSTSNMRIIKTWKGNQKDLFLSRDNAMNLRRKGLHLIGEAKTHNQSFIAPEIVMQKCKCEHPNPCPRRKWHVFCKFSIDLTQD
jgi:hypothetical protein